jgi:hypothetical protein
MKAKRLKMVTTVDLKLISPEFWIATFFILSASENQDPYFERQRKSRSLF